MQHSPQSFSWLAVMAASITFLSFTGCAEDGPPRTALWGKATWQGRAIPRGVVYFNPDVPKGNTGPQGYALILDGNFDTRKSPGKGCVVGPHIVQVKGFTGQNISDSRPYGNPLFAEYETTLDVSAEDGEIDLVIPDSVKAAPPVANEYD